MTDQELRLECLKLAHSEYFPSNLNLYQDSYIDELREKIKDLADEYFVAIKFGKG